MNLDSILKSAPVWAFEQSSNWSNCHYLDNAATTQILYSAQAAMTDFENNARANVRRGMHWVADEADERYENARASVAKFLGAKAGEVVFTSGATAALNMLAWSLGERLGQGDEIVVSALEHHSNLVPWQMLAKRTGARLVCLPVTDEGVMDLSNLEDYITNKCQIVAVTHVSNVTGLITDINVISRACRAVGATLVVDSAQAIPHGLVSKDADFLVFSGHKVFGPTGVGVLFGRQELLAGLTPAFGGGGMVARVELTDSKWVDGPARFEAGTPPFVQAAGLASALDWLQKQDCTVLANRMAELLNRAISGLSSIPGVSILGPTDEVCRIGMVSFTIDGVHPHDICQVLNEDNVLVRAGHLCAQPFMGAMGVPGVVRASFAPYNTLQDVNALLQAVDKARELLV